MKEFEQIFINVKISNEGMFGKKKYLSQEDYIKEFGKELGWSIEKTEFQDVNIAGGYQTADQSEEDVYPASPGRVKITVEKPNTSIEETYYWFLHWLRQERGYTQIEKIYDIFSASENSAVFGNMASRHGIQQDRAAQYLRGIGELIKQLFQLVRELRIIDERLEPYREWDKKKSADVTLKHLYVQQVEGGGQNPDSVYGLAQKVGYTVLPDLFFNAHIFSLDAIDKEIDKGQFSEFNNAVKTVLKRKLFLYINWKLKTEKELEARRRFQLQYLRQHWSVIQLYMSWVRPYLKTTQRMERSDASNSADLISLFDGTIMEIEVLAKRPLNMKQAVSGKDKHYNCVLATFRYTTKPTLSYKPEYQQQAVAHSGKVEVTLRPYGWHQKDIEQYKKMRRETDLEILHYLNEHVGGAMDYLGEEFEKYLEEAQEETAVARKKEREEEEEKKRKAKEELDNKRKRFNKLGPLGPFFEMGEGIGELFGSMVKTGPKRKQQEKKDTGEERNKQKLKQCEQKAMFEARLAFRIYKKAHGHLEK